MDLEQIVTNYGYIGVLIGTFLEGETILIIAGFLAHQGYLELIYVIVAAFVGTLAGDQLYFYIGRFKGKKFIENRPAWQPRIKRVNTLLDKHQTLVILGFRFVYGIRTVVPFVLGTSGISPIRFLILNACGAFVWAVVIGALGYYFGYAVEGVLGNIKHYEKWIIAVIILMGTTLWLIYLLRIKKNQAWKIKQPSYLVHTGVVCSHNFVKNNISLKF